MKNYFIFVQFFPLCFSSQTLGFISFQFIEYSAQANEKQSLRVCNIFSLSKLSDSLVFYHKQFHQFLLVCGEILFVLGFLLIEFRTWKFMEAEWIHERKNFSLFISVSCLCFQTVKTGRKEMETGIHEKLVISLWSQIYFLSISSSCCYFSAVSQSVVQLWWFVSSSTHMNSYFDLL